MVETSHLECQFVFCPGGDIEHLHDDLFRCSTCKKSFTTED